MANMISEMAAEISKRMPTVLTAIMLERKRQNHKWGRQKHSNEVWQTIALEEFGEISKAMLEGGRVNKELIQTAAVLVAWAEDQDERGEFPTEEFGMLNQEAKRRAMSLDKKTK